MLDECEYYLENNKEAFLQSYILRFLNLISHQFNSVL